MIVTRFHFKTDRAHVFIDQNPGATVLQEVIELSFETPDELQEFVTQFWADLDSICFMVDGNTDWVEYVEQISNESSS